MYSLRSLRILFKREGHSPCITVYPIQRFRFEGLLSRVRSNARQPSDCSAKVAQNRGFSIAESALLTGSFRITVKFISPHLSLDG